MSLTVIQEVKAGMHRNELEHSEAYQALMNTGKEELADFIITAFDKGWVTNYNLGLNHEGKPL